MTSMTVTTVRLPDDLTRAMQKLHARDGMPPSEQIRRGLKMLLIAKKVYTAKKEKK